MSLTDGSSGNDAKPRIDFISWDDYFMATALLAAQRSKDPHTQVGACIVNSDNVIVGLGYNGFPKGCEDDKFSWAKRHQSPTDNKHLYVCHAEVNAILNKNSRDAKNCKLYVTLFPCNECAKFIIQSEIKEIFYIDEKKPKSVENLAAKKMFNAAGVKYSAFSTKKRKIIIDFGEAYQRDNDPNVNSKSSPPKKPRSEKIDSSN